MSSLSHTFTAQAQDASVPQSHSETLPALSAYPQSGGPVYSTPETTHATHMNVPVPDHRYAPMNYPYTMDSQSTVFPMNPYPPTRYAYPAIQPSDPDAVPFLFLPPLPNPHCTYVLGLPKPGLGSTNDLSNHAPRPSQVSQFQLQYRFPPTLSASTGRQHWPAQQELSLSTASAEGDFQASQEQNVPPPLWQEPLVPASPTRNSKRKGKGKSSPQSEPVAKKASKKRKRDEAAAEQGETKPKAKRQNFAQKFPKMKPMINKFSIGMQLPLPSSSSSPQSTDTTASPLPGPSSSPQSTDTTASPPPTFPTSPPQDSVPSPVLNDDLSNESDEFFDWGAWFENHPNEV